MQLLRCFNAGLNKSCRNAAVIQNFVKASEKPAVLAPSEKLVFGNFGVLVLPSYYVTFELKLH